MPKNEQKTENQAVKMSINHILRLFYKKSRPNSLNRSYQLYTTWSAPKSGIFYTRKLIQAKIKQTRFQKLETGLFKTKLAAFKPQLPIVFSPLHIHGAGLRNSWGANAGAVQAGVP